MGFQLPIYFLLGTLAYVFPQQASALAISLVAFSLWQRRR